MRIRLVALALIFAALAIYNLEAASQTPRPDVPLEMETGTVTLTCVPTVPMDHVIEACFLRTDLDPDVDLGCIPALGGALGTKDLTIAITEDQNAEIRCFTIGSNNMESELSENAGTVNFTKPGKPYIEDQP
jgi:hypothetical protein